MKQPQGSITAAAIIVLLGVLTFFTSCKKDDMGVRLQETIDNIAYQCIQGLYSLDTLEFTEDDWSYTQAPQEGEPPLYYTFNQQLTITDSLAKPMNTVMEYTIKDHILTMKLDKRNTMDFNIQYRGLYLILTHTSNNCNDHDERLVLRRIYQP